MNEKDLYRIAYLRIKDALDEWGSMQNNEKEFANYVAGVTEFCDDILELLEQNKL